MFELDDKFFEEIGLNAMPQNEKESFKNHVQEEIQVRVGERISDGMTIEKMQEFENIIDNVPGAVDGWLNQNVPNYRSDEIFSALKQQNQTADEESILSEYAAMKWLSINRPDFTQVIATVMDEVKRELRTNAGKILG